MGFDEEDDLPRPPPAAAPRPVPRASAQKSGTGRATSDTFPSTAFDATEEHSATFVEASARVPNSTRSQGGTRSQQGGERAQGAEADKTSAPPPSRAQAASQPRASSGSQSRGQQQAQSAPRVQHPPPGVSLPPKQPGFSVPPFPLGSAQSMPPQHGMSTGRFLTHPSASSVQQTPGSPTFLPTGSPLPPDIAGPPHFQHPGGGFIPPHPQASFAAGGFSPTAQFAQPPNFQFGGSSSSVPPPSTNGFQQARPAGGGAGFQPGSSFGNFMNLQMGSATASAGNMTTTTINGNIAHQQNFGPLGINNLVNPSTLLAEQHRQRNPLLSEIQQNQSKIATSWNLEAGNLPYVDLAQLASIFGIPYSEPTEKEERRAARKARAAQRQAAAGHDAYQDVSSSLTGVKKYQEWMLMIEEHYPDHAKNVEVVRKRRAEGVKCVSRLFSDRSSFSFLCPPDEETTTGWPGSAMMEESTGSREDNSTSRDARPGSTGRYNNTVGMSNKTRPGVKSSMSVSAKAAKLKSEGEELRSASGATSKANNTSRSGHPQLESMKPVIPPDTLILPFGLNIHQQKFQLEEKQKKSTCTRGTQTEESLLLHYIQERLLEQSQRMLKEKILQLQAASANHFLSTFRQLGGLGSYGAAADKEARDSGNQSTYIAPPVRH
ncbi:unnamed protein product [Amoebophrya sp. A25]|nr:unnamed protein product [Amoebophrya sp. A25]|eukprot:GSA25T00000831001.1